MRILLLTPPMTQLNTPYPATAYLTGFLRLRGYDARQSDPALELILRVFSRPGMRRLRELLPSGRRSVAPAIAFFQEHADRYEELIEPTVAFLQGKDPSLALRIISRDFLPEGPRFSAIAEVSDVAGNGL